MSLLLEVQNNIVEMNFDPKSIPSLTGIQKSEDT